MYGFINIFLSSWASSSDAEISASDNSSDEELSSTQPYISDDEDDEIQCPLLVSYEEIASDLEEYRTVRALVARILRCGLIEDALFLPKLAYPLICIGTGRNLYAMRLLCSIPTLIRESDICIDINKNIKPDYNENGFSISYILPHTKRGIVVFAHVGPGDIQETPEIRMSLARYFDSLIVGGYFIYISEVLSDAAIIKERLDQFSSMWITLLIKTGFSFNKIFVNDESGIYGENSASMVVIAQKPA